MEEDVGKTVFEVLIITKVFTVHKISHTTINFCSNRLNNLTPANSIQDKRIVGLVGRKGLSSQELKLLKFNLLNWSWYVNFLYNLSCP